MVAGGLFRGSQARTSTSGGVRFVECVDLADGVDLDREAVDLGGEAEVGGGAEVGDQDSDRKAVRSASQTDTTHARITAEALPESVLDQPGQGKLIAHSGARLRPARADR